MNREFILDFILCKIKINFTNFENEYIEFFEKIYSSYIKNDVVSEVAYFQITLTQDNDVFYANTDMLDSNVQTISDLYNIIHYVICTIICAYCDEQGFMVLHASAFCLNGKNILLSGIKSAGKTTALLFFLKNGAQYLGDETVVISSKGMIPYQLPLRAKEKTINFLQETYGYKYDFYVSPDKIQRKKKYLSRDNSFKMRKIEDWIKCDGIIFLNESNAQKELLCLNEYNALNKLLPCVRNKVSIALSMLMIKNTRSYSRDFALSLEQLRDFF